jgi:hypothetical protein
MRKKPNRKNKKSTRKGEPKAPLPLPPPAIQTVSRRQIRSLEVLGILIGIIGLITLIELFPLLSASQQSPFLARDQVPSVSITNDGYFWVTDVKIACFGMNVKIGGATVGFVMSGEGSPPQAILKPTESYTVSCSDGGILISAPTNSISQMDVGAVVYYRPWPFTFLRCRRFYRFEGRNDGVKLNWFKEPPNDTDKKFDEFVKHTGMKFP